MLRRCSDLWPALAAAGRARREDHSSAQLHRLVLRDARPAFHFPERHAPSAKLLQIARPLSRLAPADRRIGTRAKAGSKSANLPWQRRVVLPPPVRGPPQLQSTALRLLPWSFPAASLPESSRAARGRAPSAAGVQPLFARQRGLDHLCSGQNKFRRAGNRRAHFSSRERVLSAVRQARW